MIIEELVKKYDPENQFDVLKNSHRQIEYAWNNSVNTGAVDTAAVRNIIISGLGGSAIAGDLLKNFLKDDLSCPLLINRNYNLPVWVDETTLVIVSSYSGNTEETLSVLYAALQKKCRIICITTGGEMLDVANAHDVPVVLLERGYQPRYALGLSFFTLLKIFQTLGFIADHTSFVDNMVWLWEARADDFVQEGNWAFTSAESLTGYIPVIYSAADYTDVIGNRFKSQLNENSKVHAFMNVFPELNHNEIVGWETFRDENFRAKVVMIIDPSYHTQLMKRFNITADIISEAGAEVIRLESKLDTRKERLLDLVYLCDWISYFLALLRGKDPSEIDNIHLLKKRLAP